MRSTPRSRPSAAATAEQNNPNQTEQTKEDMDTDKKNEGSHNEQQITSLTDVVKNAGISLSAENKAMLVAIMQKVNAPIVSAGKYQYANSTDGKVLSSILAAEHARLTREREEKKAERAEAKSKNTKNLLKKKTGGFGTGESQRNRYSYRNIPTADKLFCVGPREIGMLIGVGRDTATSIATTCPSFPRRIDLAGTRLRRWRTADVLEWVNGLPSLSGAEGVDDAE